MNWMKNRIDGERKERREAIDAAFRARHPAIAKHERGLRKSRRDRETIYARRDRMEDGGTPETRAKAARTHQGCLARLYERGHLTIDQLAAGEQIRAVAERLGRDVAIGTVSLETRVDQSRSGTGVFFEALGAVRAEVAYRRWSAELGRVKGRAPVASAVILDGEAASRAARRLGMRTVTLRERLRDGLDLWTDLLGRACEEIEEADVLAAQAGLL